MPVRAQVDNFLDAAKPDADTLLVLKLGLIRDEHRFLHAESLSGSQVERAVVMSGGSPVKWAADRTIVSPTNITAKDMEATGSAIAVLFPGCANQLAIVGRDRSMRRPGSALSPQVRIFGCCRTRSTLRRVRFH